MRRTVKLLASLELTVVCLALALVLVFVGTLAQVDEGLYQAQTRYFRSFVVWWSPGGDGLRLPVLPGGYTVGVVLLANLLAAHSTRFKLSRKKIGMFAIHAGLIVLLVGQLASDMLSVHSTLRLERGQTASSSEDLFEHELAITGTDGVLASVSLERLEHGEEVRLEQPPLTLRAKAFWPHAQLLAEPAEGALRMVVTQGAGKDGFYISPLPAPTDPDERAKPAAVVELESATAPLGSWVVSPLVRAPQRLDLEGRAYEIALGPRRHANRYSITLVDLRHDVYPGTDIPRDYSSRVRIRNPENDEDREVVISMNQPLRYEGSTYYQYQMETGSEATVLQVVRNPSWLTPYLSCGLVGLGLLVQFGSHLFGFVRRGTP